MILKRTGFLFSTGLIRLYTSSPSGGIKKGTNALTRNI